MLARIQHYIASLTYLTISHLSFIHLLQIDADDVITRDEQIYVLIGAHAKCEKNIQAQIALVKGLCAAFPLKVGTRPSSASMSHQKGQMFLHFYHIHELRVFLVETHFTSGKVNIGNILSKPAGLKSFFFFLSKYSNALLLGK